MIIPDLNLLRYAYDAASPHHDAAVSWWEGSLNGPEAVGLPSDSTSVSRERSRALTPRSVPLSPVKPLISRSLE